MPGFDTGRDFSRGPGETANADVHLPFLHRLPPPLRRALERVGSDQKFAAGADLMRAGHTTNWIGVITRGVVRVCGHDVASQRVIAHRRDGDLIGELAAFGLQRRSATVTAVTPVSALVLHPQQLDQLMSRFPAFLTLVLGVVAERMVESDRYRIESDTAPVVKVARALVGAARENATGAATVHIVSQEDFGSIIGTSRKTVGRVLADLRRKELISTRRGVVQLHDVPKLRELAQLDH
ncbi:hypothetical protein CF165_01175 [Amycolatopsis vastitatis]|uniref:Crp/Fnr family transcriptional regulator n=1 Tax=Amycolatopsis vastitatis TaxID=1905142 RepID=A0A229TKJ8_9PSEU|nr:hypothetical protein CF165_01175 [Amycolatopsis vastitatis]